MSQRGHHPNNRGSYRHYNKRARYHRSHNADHSRPNPNSRIQYVNNSQSQFQDNVKIVQEHYNVIKEKNRDDRQKSDAYSLRCFNNWVKQVQIEDSVNQVVESLGAETNSGIRVLDICCGKGGDQNKWKKKELVKHIDFVDISNVSVRECELGYFKIG